MSQYTPQLNNDNSFTDAYQLFGVAFAIIMFENVYGPLTDGQETGIKISASVGAVAGQPLFGLLSDLFGRKKGSCTGGLN